MKKIWQRKLIIWNQSLKVGRFHFWQIERQKTKLNHFIHCVNPKAKGAYLFYFQCLAPYYLIYSRLQRYPCQATHPTLPESIIYIPRIVQNYNAKSQCVRNRQEQTHFSSSLVYSQIRFDNHHHARTKTKPPIFKRLIPFLLFWFFVCSKQKRRKR